MDVMGRPEIQLSDTARWVSSTLPMLGVCRKLVKHTICNVTSLHLSSISLALHHDSLAFCNFSLAFCNKSFAFYNTGFSAGFLGSSPQTKRFT